MKQELTAGAAAALHRAGFSRRVFLKTSGALIVGFAADRTAVAQFGLAPIAGSPSTRQLDSWLAIAANGSVTAYSGKEELGQGISTAQTQLVAEELCVPLERVTLIYCDTQSLPTNRILPAASPILQISTTTIWPRRAPPRARRCCGLGRSACKSRRTGFSLKMARSARRAKGRSR
jgi:CO/xanthine dehydrogenase Mo-binding subunit